MESRDNWTAARISQACAQGAAVPRSLLHGGVNARIIASRMSIAPITLHPRPDSSPLARRLKQETQSEVLFDAASRGRYSTDASIYQIEPVGVVIPKTESDAQIALQIAREEGVAVLPRGGGTSQCGQTV